ncbi:MAG TPA: hypothetical protein VIS55_02445 [Pseudomonadales bacterium]
MTVPTNFPVPVLDKLPLNMGIYLSDDLLNYVHAERLENAGSWQISLGDAQPAMFNNLLSGMFQGVETILDPSAPSAGVNGVLVPSIQEVQFSIPSQTRSDYYEVWIRYQFQLYDGEGQLLADWPLTAYGKADEDNYGLSTDQPALQAAALAACRDAMAFFTVQFRDVPSVKAWLDRQLGGTS